MILTLGLSSNRWCDEILNAGSDPDSALYEYVGTAHVTFLHHRYSYSYISFPSLPFSAFSFQTFPFQALLPFIHSFISHLIILTNQARI